MYIVFDTKIHALVLQRHRFIRMKKWNEIEEEVENSRERWEEGEREKIIWKSNIAVVAEAEAEASSSWVIAATKVLRTRRKILWVLRMWKICVTQPKIPKPLSQNDI